MKADEKHFREVVLYAFRGYDDPITLEDNTFGDITFEVLSGFRIKRIGSSALNNTANKLRTFYCVECEIDNEPPKYDIQKVEIMLLEKQNLKSFSCF